MYVSNCIRENGKSFKLLLGQQKYLVLSSFILKGKFENALFQLQFLLTLVSNGHELHEHFKANNSRIKQEPQDIL